jgi:hypothetical protein
MDDAPRLHSLTRTLHRGQVNGPGKALSQEQERRPAMYRLLIPCAILVLFTAFSSLPAGDQAPRLMVAQGAVDKVEKDGLAIKPRSADGKFQKAITLKTTGTSRITLLAPQTREGKQVLTQRDTELKDLQANQAIAIIYADGDPPTLLSAVVEAAASEKSDKPEKPDKPEKSGK